MRVLVCEDDAVVTRGLERALRRAGYRVEHAADVREALDAIRAEPPDLALVDLGLPDGSGFDVVERLRDHPAVGIVVLTARDEELDRVRGLRAGADDYITKPFSLVELLARIEALGRRMRHVRQATTSPTRHRFTHGRMTFDPVDHTVVRSDNSIVALTRKESDMLALLLAHIGATVARETALDLVWQQLPTGASRSLDTHIGTLRAKLGADATITTVRGVGYRLESAAP